MRPADLRGDSAVRLLKGRHLRVVGFVTCPPLSARRQGGARVKDTGAAVAFQQLSSEHHVGHELWLTNATSVSVHCMQTEDRSPDAAPTASVIAEGGTVADVTGLFSYYAANVSSGECWPGCAASPSNSRG